MSRTAIALVFAGCLVATPVLAGDTVKQSGRIDAIDPAQHTLTLEELGVWTGTARPPIRRAIEYGPATKFELVTRSKGPDVRGWPGGYSESALTASELRPGDFATVTLTREGRKLQATTVEIVRPDGQKGVPG